MPKVHATFEKPSSQRRIAFATIIGSTVEWYDYAIYASASSLVFANLFFEPAGKSLGLLLAFASVGVSFLFRPLGAALAGNFGDRLGRRRMLVLTLLCMGGATTLMGVIPSFGTIGYLAPVLLLVLRIIQGVSAGGEWGGAVLMAVEHAPKTHRGRAGAVPQLGVPLGMLLAFGVTSLMTSVVSPGEAYADWGWRIPFLLSAVMIVVGMWVRRTVDESPVFEEITSKKTTERLPLAALLKKHWFLVILAALLFAGHGAVGYMTTGGFITAYATDPEGPVALPYTAVLTAVTLSGVLFFLFTALGGMLADLIGRKRTFLLGYGVQALTVLPLFPLMNTGKIEMLFLAIGLLTIGMGFTYGPQAAWYSEMFPASIRYSGVALSYALGAILGSAFAPMIATALIQITGHTSSVVVYLLGMTAIAAVAALILRDRAGIELGPENEANQAANATIFAPNPKSTTTK